MQSELARIPVARILPIHSPERKSFSVLLLHRADVLNIVRTLCALSFVALLSGAVVLDRVAVVVGKRLVKASDVDRNVRVSQFLNRTPLKLNEEERRKVADRLIDQELIRQEMM